MAISISSVSGTVAHGQSITISGSGFGAKGGADPNKPIMWADFSGGSIARTGNLSVGTLLNQNCTASAVQAYGQSGYAARGIPANGQVRLYLTTSGSDNMKCYTHVKRYFADAGWWNGLQSSCNYKLTRPDSDVGNNLCVTILDGTVITTAELPGETKWWSDGTYPAVQQWNTEEYEFGQGTYNNANGSSRIWWNGVDQQGGLWNFHGITVSGQYWSTFDVQNLVSGTHPPASYVYMADYYFDTTWARVLIGDQNTLATSTHREIQIPTAWAAGSITIQVNRGTFGASDRAYLYAIPSTGIVDVNPTGYEITFGNGGGSPPTGSIFLTVT